MRTAKIEDQPFMEQRLQEIVTRVRSEVGRIIRDKGFEIDLLLVGLLGGGHVLLEDVPGVGKTTLAKALAQCFAVDFARIQFTPDLMPADVVGSQVLDPREGAFNFHAGPIFTNVLLADEINRASPRTQSSLLEAMNESQVTVEGHTHPLSAPFFVIATQNPVEFQGTYPLPEAQLDRFLLRFGLGYPSPEEELQVIFDRQDSDPLDDITAVASAKELLEIQARVRHVRMSDDIGKYLLRIVQATRSSPWFQLGVSTRGALAFYRAAQALSLLRDRDHVLPDDLQDLAVAVLGHRVIFTPEARYGGKTEEAALREILQQVEIPL